MACYQLRLKAVQSTSQGKIGGVAMYTTVVFYLQTHSIMLPRSISLGVRGGVQQACGLSLK